MSRLLTALVVTAMTPILVSSSWADHQAGGKNDMEGVVIYAPNQIKWSEGPPSIPKGAMAAVLDGDPAKEGPFVMRFKFPAGYRIAPHTHPKDERVTVLSGALFIGMGGKFDEKTAMEMTAGSFGRWVAGMKHFAYTKGETVIQLNGMGPWSIQYVNPEDDPRKQKK